MTHAPTTIRFTRAQARALVTIGRALEPEIRGAFDDHRCRRAAQRAFDAIDDALRGVRRDPLDLDLDRFADVHGALRDAEMATPLRARVRDLLATLVLWQAIEQLPAQTDRRGLLVAESIDDLAWRAEALDLLRDNGVDVVLPGERR